ncbi:MAG: substrate-binding domain-containing protein, partial [Eubacteriales bacterium]|nr:substrate-binding domain-containing protein [Eubacteriales bacterium]
VIIPNLYLHYFSELLNQVLLTYEENGYKFLVFVGNRKEEVERRYIRELMSYQIEGLLVMSHTIPSDVLAGLGIPIVSIEREDACISSVNCDNYMGAIQAVSLLTHRDCEVIIHINTPTVPSIPAYQRIVGFKDFCKEHGLKHEIFVRDMGEDYETMQRAMSEILDEIEEKYPNIKKGIFFSDDTRANCFLNLLIRRFKTLPEDYKLVGFDNSPISTEAVYSISTVGQQIDVIAKEAVSLLIEQIEERKNSEGSEVPAPVHKVITPVLYQRETTEL